MRINQYVALATGLSRRAADKLIGSGHVYINGKPAILGSTIKNSDTVLLKGKRLNLPKTSTILLNKPKGYVCSRLGQGHKTIYELLPNNLKSLKPVGRLDKDSSGLLLLTNDGQLSFDLTHPSKQKQKVYLVKLDQPLAIDDKTTITQGVKLSDGISTLSLRGSGKNWTITMHEGRNRQIRRTFEALGYKIESLHRTIFGSYDLKDTGLGEIKVIKLDNK